MGTGAEIGGAFLALRRQQVVVSRQLASTRHGLKLYGDPGMDLFAASGVDLGDGGKGGRSGRSVVARTLKVPLLKYKVVADAIKGFTFDLNQRQIDAATRYAKTVKSSKFAKMKETAVRPLFCQEVLGEFLGYTQVDAEKSHSLAFEMPLGRGAVDVALGRFGTDDDTNEIVAPFELKGPGTKDLDAIMPGRGRSPVQQAWDYANDAPGCRWVLVSNCVELRLYGFGRGREAYEMFDLTKLDDRYEQERLWLLLSAPRLLGGATEALLRATDSAYKTITDELYVQYKELRQQLIQFLTDAPEGPKLHLASAIEPAQKILDRILFIAFAERTALLPDKLLERATKAANEFRPEPIWRNFLGLFRGVDKGDTRLSIWPYNGGLFAHDPAVDTLELPDDLTRTLARLGEWDYRDDVPVTLLGHLFEQSITDLERLRAESRGEEAPKISKRKREGVVYTPDIVTRFLVERTIGATLTERFVALLTKHGKAKPENGDPIFAETETAAERAFWRDYAAVLRVLRIVDPACGSGAFLVAAFDRLAAEYRRVVEHLAVLGETIDFDPFDEIVTKNLYGVDLNSESVEITRLALWLKTARNKHRLQNLEASIKVGNSLIDDKVFTDHPFDWRTAFPEVFAEGGFDIVIGNPPYVRMELIKPVKPYLEKHYIVADDRADLYAYFFERGVSVLRGGGRLGYISSSTFFRTGSGENLRKFLGDNVAVEAVVDFGDLQIFEGVTTYPAIVTLRKGAAEDDGALSFLKIDALPKDLDAEFSARAQFMPRIRLGAGSWQFEDDSLARLRDKIIHGKKTLGEVYGEPAAGIKTGRNEAFVINRETRDELIKADKNSEKLIKPFAMGDSAYKWIAIDRDNFVIYIPRDQIDIDDYSAIKKHLLPFKASLEARALDQKWFELQQAQTGYEKFFIGPKIIFRDISDRPTFSFDESGFYIDMTCFCLPTADLAVLALLNSRSAWFFWKSMTPELRGGFVRLKRQFVTRLPIPEMPADVREKLSQLAGACTVTLEKLQTLKSAANHRMLDLAPPEHAKLSRRLREWWVLDFAAFRDEVKRVFKSEIPVKERGEWEAYLAKQGAEVKALDAEIGKAEREIDAIVYRLFNLTPDEISLLEASIAGAS